MDGGRRHGKGDTAAMVANLRRFTLSADFTRRRHHRNVDRATLTGTRRRPGTRSTWDRCAPDITHGTWPSTATSEGSVQRRVLRRGGGGRRRLRLRVGRQRGRCIPRRLRRRRRHLIVYDDPEPQPGARSGNGSGAFSLSSDMPCDRPTEARVSGSTWSGDGAARTVTGPPRSGRRIGLPGRAIRMSRTGSSRPPRLKVGRRPLCAA